MTSRGALVAVVIGALAAPLQSAAQSTYRISDGVSSPRVLHRVAPEYSEKARKAKLQGTVLLAVEVWEDGRAHNVQVLRSLGFGLDEKAIEAIQKWKFVPGQKDGKPVRTTAQIQVSFRLVVRNEGDGPSLQLPNDEAAADARRTTGGPILAETSSDRPNAPPDAGSGPGSGGGPLLPGGVSQPRVLHRVEPKYSDDARWVKYQGTVFLAVEVWEDGLAHNIRVLRSLGLGLDENAIEAVKMWKFVPGRKDGKPVRVAAQIQVKFRLL